MSRMAWLVLLVVVGVAAGGLAQLRLQADIFGLLPQQLPVIRALNLYQRAFGNDREAMVVIHADSAAQASEAAELIAAQLQRRDLSPEVLYLSPWREDLAAQAELIAALWWNSEPEAVQGLLQRLQADNVPLLLQRALQRVATSFSAEDIGRWSLDPLGLTRLPGAESVQPAQDPFLSADGRTRLVYVQLPESVQGLRASFAWSQQLQQMLEQLQPAQGGWQAGLTGTPVIQAHFGQGLLHDLRLAGLSTLLLVGLLFFVAYRRWAPLLWMVCLLVLVLILTTAVAGWLFQPLNVISLGFGAILLGLAAGYALLLYQQWLARPHQDFRAAQRAIGPSIAWAAATTAGAFFLVGRSSLPGMMQLGVLVGLGIAIAAALMISMFLWPLARRALHEEDLRSTLLGPVSLLSSAGVAWVGSGVALISALMVLWWNPPVVDPGTAALGLHNSPPRQVLAELQQRMPVLGTGPYVLVQGHNSEAVAQRLQALEQRLRPLQEQGVLERLDLPTRLWPQPEQVNRAALQLLAQRRQDLVQAIAGGGFAQPAQQLAMGVLQAWSTWADEGLRWDQAGTRWLHRRFAAADGAQVLAMGRMHMAAQESGPVLQTLAVEVEQVPGALLASWELASASLLEVMQGDALRVLLPMLVALLGLLWLAYRSLASVLLSLLSLGLSVLLLQAVMVLMGWSWNLMNLLAVPLLLGVAVDYSIHVQLALQRCQGDLQLMHASVGRAIVLAAATTAAGFGSLGLADNVGLASLGRVCATGVLLAAGVALALLPQWWRSAQPRSLNQGDNA